MNHTSLGKTDGFRDYFTDQEGPGLMNPETIAGLTHALAGLTCGENGGIVVVGMDNRPLNKPLELAAIAGAQAANAEVVRLGVAPTPLVLRTADFLGADAAVILTASHNPPKYGGWKGTLGSDKPYGDQVEAIDSGYWQQVDSGLTLPVEPFSDVTFRPEFIDRYINDVVADVTAEFGEQPLAGKLFVVDTANGAAMNVTPIVLERLGAIVERFACDGLGPINEGCGAAELDGVEDYLKAHPELVSDSRFVGALTNDGDADRFIGVGATIGNNGNMTFETLDGNRVIELIALGEPGVVATEYANDGSKRRVESQGVVYELCPNSDVEVTNALRQHQKRGEDWSRGGEFTGHHVDLRWLSSGDGVRMAAWVAAFASTRSTTIAEICQTMPLWPDKMRKLQLRSGMGVAALADKAVKDTIEVSADEQASGLRFVVRESGTEKDAMRIWGVGQDETMVLDRTQQIYDSMTRYAA